MATIFSRIVAGEIPSYKVAENDKFYAFLDINPLVKGHTLVIPKQEVDYIFDLSDEDLAEMQVFAKKVAAAIKSAFPCIKVPGPLNLSRRAMRYNVDSAFFLAVQNDSAREELLKIARTADDFKIPYIRIFGRFPASGLSDELLEICCNNLNWFKNQNFQVQLALETHDTFCQVPKVMELMKCCGPMPVIWDAHHTARFADEALADSFGMLKENIIEVHFKDSHFEGAEKKYVGDIPGQGEMPLHELFTLLEKEKFPHPVIFE